MPDYVVSIKKFTFNSFYFSVWLLKISLIVILQLFYHIYKERKSFRISIYTSLLLTQNTNKISIANISRDIKDRPQCCFKYSNLILNSLLKFRTSLVRFFSIAINPWSKVFESRPNYNYL